MTHDEFESILEELFEEGYNQALFDIQEDILDESAYDIENEYNLYIEQMFLEHTPFHRKEFMRGILEEVPKDERKEVDKYTSPENKKAMSEKPWNKLSKGEQDDLQADYAVKAATKLEPKINNSIGDKIHNLKNRLRNALDVSRAYNKASKE